MFRLHRHEFTAATKRAAFARSAGVCECARVPALMAILSGRPCGVALATGNIQYHHIVADAIRPDNSLSNCSVLTRTCHALVTDLHDKKVIAQAKRRADRARGIGRIPRTALPGTVRSGIARGFDGVPRDRETGAQWPKETR